MSMNVLLISNDAELQKLIRGVLAECLGAAWRLVIATQQDLTRKADVYIWDYHSGLRMSDLIDPSEHQKHFVLVQRKQLSQFREESLPDVNVVLKPVSAAALKAFLGEACARWQRQQAEHENEAGSVGADRDEVLQSLIEANLKLQEYDQDRTNFLARAIHDFRAPLTALTGYCGLLLGEQLGVLTADQREVIQRMQFSAKRLSRLASEMFQLSICHRVVTRPNLRRNDIHECVDQALHEIAPFAETKRISVSVDLQQPAEPLAFEPSELEQVLVNLLDNACKFTPRSGSIDVKGYPFFWERRKDGITEMPLRADRRTSNGHAPNSFRIDISDSGPGIPPNHIETIFEEYTSYAGGQDRSGGGLGLAICKMIMNRHHGRVWAESSPRGAVFSLVLPSPAAEHLLPTDAAPSENKYYTQVS